MLSGFLSLIRLRSNRYSSRRKKKKKEEEEEAAAAAAAASSNPHVNLHQRTLRHRELSGRCGRIGSWIVCDISADVGHIHFYFSVYLLRFNASI